MKQEGKSEKIVFTILLLSIIIAPTWFGYMVMTTDREEVQHEFDKTKFQIEIIEDKLEVCKYSSSPTAVGCVGRKGDICVIYVPSINYVDEEELFAIWGHELYHCAYGSFHSWGDEK